MKIYQLHQYGGEWVRCTKCIHVEDCDIKEDRDGCYFGETDEELTEEE